MTAVDEVVDTSAADQAWWDMDVVCDHLAGECDAPAAWLQIAPCGCRRPKCEAHRAWHFQQPNPRRTCARCGATPLPADAYAWEPL